MPIWSTVESPRFAARFGAPADWVPGGAIVVEPLRHHISSGARSIEVDGEAAGAEHGYLVFATIAAPVSPELTSSPAADVQVLWRR